MPAAFDSYFESMDESILSLMGEDCDYFPKTGGQRTVAAAVDEEITEIEDRFGRWRLETLNVLVSRDADIGIAAPQSGDSFRREGASDDELFPYQGVRREVSRSHWLLSFSRKVPLEHGGNRMPR